MQDDKRWPCLDSTVLNPHTTACSDECAYYPERAGTHTFWDEVLLLVRLGEGFLYCRGGGGLAPVSDVSSLEGVVSLQMHAIRTDECACLFHSADAAGAGPQLQQLCNPPRG